MNPALKRFFQIFFILISTIFLVWLIRNFDLNTLSQISLTTLFSVFAVRILNFFHFQMTSFVFFRSFNERARLFSLILLNTSTSVSNYATPVKIGFPLQLYLMKKMMKIPYTKSGAMVFVNLLISYFIAMMLGIIAVLYLSMDAFSIMTSFKLMLFVL
ncbi:MAG: flippase-like domain-containing protein, partial [Bacteroidetes bacterium]|nr:flippase-like domain-containing protein [Bacteroidota bacterium]